MKKKDVLIVSFFWFFLFLMSCICAGKEGALAQEYFSDTQVIVGEAFGKPVTADEFIYYYKTAAIFTRSGKANRTEEDIRQEAWQNLIFIHEAKELNIIVSPEELKEELERLMAEKDIEYGSEDYHEYIKKQFNEDSNTFEHRIEDLLIINKFMAIKTNPEVTVTEEEMKQKFLNQYNSFESEYIRFDTEEAAKEFLEKVKKNPKLWKETYDEKKSLGQKGASWINIMSLEALIDLWNIPKEDAYRILSHNEGDFIVAKFYYGDAVFRLLQKKEADIKKYDEKKRKYYKDMLTAVKKRKIIKEYFEELLQRANYKDYVAEQMRAAKMEELKNKTSVILETNKGNIELKLFPEIAPKACENFIGLVEKGYYDGIIFHRVIKNFMIQSGDPTGIGTGGESIWGKPFANEVTDDVLFDRPGLLAMANSGPDTNTSQFFITTRKAPWLNKKHTIFGEVISGYDVVERINNAPTDSSNRPKKPQMIIRAYVKKEELKKEKLEKSQEEKQIKHTEEEVIGK
jgi:peptidylprolyl isomerase